MERELIDTDQIKHSFDTNKYFAFFTCDDTNHYIYSLDKELNPVIISMDLDPFLNEVSLYVDEYGQDALVWNSCADAGEVFGMILGAKYELELATQTVSEVLHLSDN